MPKECDGYMLVNGSSVGLGTLLERVDSKTGTSATPKPKAKAPAAKPKGTEVARFDVVVPNVMIRSLPSTVASPVGVVKKGDILEGQPRDGWLLLDYKHSVESLENGEGRWVLMHGKELGLGVLLHQILPVPSVTQTFATSVQLSFDQDVSKYSLEVEPEIGDAFHMKCCEGKSMLVHGLHPDSHVRLRFVLDKEGVLPEQRESAECNSLEADGPCVDLLGNPRGHCKQCSCKCFAVEEKVVSLNMDVGDSRCARCGCNVTAHVIWTEKEKPKAKVPGATPVAKPEIVKPVENPILDKAIALPKETMLRRWRPMDLDVSTQAWPRLPRDFSEVVAWSDLHSDMGKNMTHLRQLPLAEDTVLLLAGDVASSLEAKFGAIFYVPGNHELWVNKKDGLSSVHKFLAILEICEQLGIHTRPAFISADCAVCPLFSLSLEDNLVDGFARELADIPFDMQTQWPWDITGRGDTNDAQQPEIADFFASLNKRRVSLSPPSALEALKRAEAEAEEAKQAQLEGRLPKKAKADPGTFVITMSHFVPRQECYPGPRRLCGVMGCREIEQQARSCGSRCHIFGHSHISCDREVNGVRYVQHPLGYPNDYHRQSAPKSVWGSSKAQPGSEPDSTLAKGIAKAILDEIQASTEKCLERPDGRWNSQDGTDNVSGNIFDRKEELKLRESMGYDAKKMAEPCLKVPITEARCHKQQL
eukprot:g21743.t1